MTIRERISRPAAFQLSGIGALGGSERCVLRSLIMMSISGLTRRGRLLAACVLALAYSLFSLNAAAATFPGGFMESDTVTVTRPMLSATQIGGFLPQRGLFTFPAPYNTQ